VVSALACRGLAHDYPGPVRALAGVDLSLEQGELAVVIGPNGSGKSTLQKCLAGLVAPSAGEVWVDGERLAALDGRARARRLAVVPQFLPALHDIAVRDFVLGGRYAHFGRWQGPGPADREAVDRALEAADVADQGRRWMSELSGGQRQRVLVARALAQEARSLLIDEPTSSLDPEHQLQVFELIAGAVAGGRAALVATHDLNLAAQFATRVILLDRGAVRADGPVERVLTAELLRPVYGASLSFGTFRAADGAERPFVVPWREGSRPPDAGD
jgi:iron complex transport system ATP-binding protein